MKTLDHLAKDPRFSLRRVSLASLTFLPFSKEMGVFSTKGGMVLAIFGLAPKMYFKNPAQ